MSNKSHTEKSSGEMQQSDVFYSGEKPVFTAEPVSCSTRPLKYNEDLCTGCNRCASVCQVDILVPSVEKGKPPIVMYPGECYYCGSCVMACPVEGALRLQHPLMNQTSFVEVIPEPSEE